MESLDSALDKVRDELLSDDAGVRDLFLEHFDLSLIHI